MSGRYKSEASRRRALGNLRTGPAAPPGNRLAERHGGYSAVTDAERDLRAREVFDALAADEPLRDTGGSLPRADTLVIHLLAKCLVRLERVEEFHRDFGWLDQGTKEPRPSVELERRLRQEALDYAREIGLTPRARVALGLDLARGADLAREAAEDFERERREGGGA